MKGARGMSEPAQEYGCVVAQCKRCGATPHIAMEPLTDDDKAEFFDDFMDSFWVHRDTGTPRLSRCKCRAAKEETQ